MFTRRSPSASQVASSLLGMSKGRRPWTQKDAVVLGHLVPALRDPPAALVPVRRGRWGRSARATGCRVPVTPRRGGGFRDWAFMSLTLRRHSHGARRRSGLCCRAVSRRRRIALGRSPSPSAFRPLSGELNRFMRTTMGTLDATGPCASSSNTPGACRGSSRSCRQPRPARPDASGLRWPHPLRAL